MENKKIFDISRLWRIKYFGIPIMFWIAFFSLFPLTGPFLAKLFT
jgi:hypothetical protein